ncbi:hypothetical protein HZC09_04985 [Candidatus Micrarchaeota archaeon]|nr:hypothetical protein [Candidatus Micrarchaeota archaeon]
MNLIVDTNRLFAAIIKDSVSRRILLCPKFAFFSPNLSKKELSKYLPELLLKSKISETTFAHLVDLLFSRIHILEDANVQEYMDQARIMDSIDPDDTPFVAAALAINADGIWSDDRHFERQNLAKIFKTSRLAQLLG